MAWQNLRAEIQLELAVPAQWDKVPTGLDWRRAAKALRRRGEYQLWSEQQRERHRSVARSSARKCRATVSWLELSPRERVLAQSERRAWLAQRRVARPRLPGGRPRVLSQIQAAVAQAIWLDGDASIKELAAVYGCSAQTLRNYVAEVGT